MTNKTKTIPVGWTDVSCPEGMGYRVMTKDGMKVFDEEDKEEFEKEVAKIERRKINKK